MVLRPEVWFSAGLARERVADFGRFSPDTTYCDDPAGGNLSKS